MEWRVEETCLNAWPALREGLLDPEEVAEIALQGIRQERFLILPHPRVADGVHVVGVRVALKVGATPVPLSVTGEPLTDTLAVMVAVPVFAPRLDGEKVTLMVQAAPAAKVVPQVPPESPAGRAN